MPREHELPGQAKRLVQELASSRRKIELELDYWVQRFPVGARVKTKQRGFTGEVIDFEFQGAWASLTGWTDNGERIDRYILFHTYRVRLDGYGERGFYMSEWDMAAQ